MDTRRRLGVALLATALSLGPAACTAEDRDPQRGDSPGSGGPSRSATSQATPPTAVASPRTTPTPTTRRQRIRQVLRDRDPDPTEVIELAGTPTSWVRGEKTLLVEYSLMHPYDWPNGGTVTALQLLDRQGQVRGTWVDTARGAWQGSFWSVGDDFVGMTSEGRRPVLISDGDLVPLSRRPGSRAAEQGDIRFGDGWLLDRAARTVTRERLAGCRKDTIRTDPDGRRWCLDGRKQHVSWSDDGGRTWTRHALSTTYFEYCDGGTLGAQLQFQGDVVAIGLWRADFSTDRGRTWRDVPLPPQLVGAHRATGASEANCTGVVPLRDGRLVISYFKTAVATDATNTRFTLLRTPPRNAFAGVHEGVLVAASHRPYGDRFASYNGGRSWHPLRVRPLLRHVLENPK